MGDIYRKFGETAEAAQLLEVELGTILLETLGVAEELHTRPNPTRASDLYRIVNRHTLGQLLKSLDNRTHSVDGLEQLLAKALKARNRLFHSFYRKHNLRRNSEEGRTRMLQDLENIHTVVFNAYKAILLLNGTDVDALADELRDMPLSTEHLPI